VRVLSSLGRYFDSWRFPAQSVALLGTFVVASSVMLVVPADTGALGAFAEDFRTWCYGYDAATQGMEWGYVLAMVSSPAVLAGIIAWIWLGELRWALRNARAALACTAIAAAILTTVLFAGLGTMGSEAGAGTELAFPARELRTAHTLAPFSLVDHARAPLRSQDFAGKVTVITAVYATCGKTCPMILGQAKRVVGAIPPDLAADLQVVGITLDPERDTPDQLQLMAKGQSVGAPAFRLATGAPDEVNAVLDRLGFTRSRNPETGIIDHANLFLVVDREGRIAYRFTLGEQQEAWLVDALKLLLAEPDRRNG
jgi:protein SCO1